MPSNLLLLDEPTNHLDIPAREAIEAFLRETPATVLVVSHDRRLLETICDRLWVVADGLAVAVRRRLSRVARRGGRRLDGRGRRRGRGEAPADRRDRQAGRTEPARGRRHRRVGVGRRSGRSVAGRRAAAAASAAAAAASAAAASAPAPVAASGRDRHARSRRGSRRTPIGARRTTVEAELTRLGLRKNHLEMAIGQPGRPPRTSSSCAGSRASSRTWTSRSRAAEERVAGARRARAVTAAPRGAGRPPSSRPSAADRPHRPHRLRQVHGRRLARGAAARSSSTPTRSRATSRRPASPATTPFSRGSATRSGAPTAALDRAALGRRVFADPDGARGARADRPPARPARILAAIADAATAGRADRRHRGDQARRSRATPRSATRSGW